jgi:hypothetical protein
METANKLSLNEAREVARRLGGRVRNMKKNADTIAERTTALLVGTAGAFGLGYLMGGWDFEKSQMTEDQITNEGDPTTWFGMPRDLVLASTVAVVSFMNLGGRKTNAVTAPLALGAFCEWAGNAGREMGREAAATP